MYRRAAHALERSAQLAEWHAERDRSKGLQHSANRELDTAQRARKAARRGRALAAQSGVANIDARRPLNGVLMWR